MGKNERINREQKAMKWKRFGTVIFNWIAAITSPVWILPFTIHYCFKNTDEFKRTFIRGRNFKIGRTPGGREMSKKQMEDVMIKVLSKDGQPLSLAGYSGIGMDYDPEGDFYILSNSDFPDGLALTIGQLEDLHEITRLMLEDVEK
jgi:hypothetical protein